MYSPITYYLYFGINLAPRLVTCQQLLPARKHCLNLLLAPHWFLVLFDFVKKIPRCILEITNICKKNLFRVPVSVADVQQSQIVSDCQSTCVFSPEPSDTPICRLHQTQDAHLSVNVLNDYLLTVRQQFIRKEYLTSAWHGYIYADVFDVIYTFTKTSNNSEQQARETLSGASQLQNPNGASTEKIANVSWQ